MAHPRLQRRAQLHDRRHPHFVRVSRATSPRSSSGGVRPPVVTAARSAYKWSPTPVRCLRDRKLAFWTRAAPSCPCCTSGPRMTRGCRFVAQSEQARRSSACCGAITEVSPPTSARVVVRLPRPSYSTSRRRASRSRSLSTGVRCCARVHPNTSSSKYSSDKGSRLFSPLPFREAYPLGRRVHGLP